MPLRVRVDRFEQVVRQGYGGLHGGEYNQYDRRTTSGPLGHVGVSQETRNDETPVGRGFRKRAGDRDRTGDVQRGKLPQIHAIPHEATVPAASDADPEPVCRCDRDLISNHLDPSEPEPFRLGRCCVRIAEFERRRASRSFTRSTTVRSERISSWSRRRASGPSPPRPPRRRDERGTRSGRKSPAVRPRPCSRFADRPPAPSCRVCEPLPLPRPEHS